MQPKLIAGFLVGFALVASLASGVLHRDGYSYLAKVHAAAAGPGVNVAFFGTSRIEFGIMPEAFDQAMGDGVRSYNAARAGDSVLMERLEIEELFARKPLGLRFVLIEPDYTGAAVVRQPGTLRAVEFFSLRGAWDTAQFMDFPVRQPAPELKPAQYLGNIIAGTLRHYSNIGLAWAQADPQTDSSAAGRGYPDLDPRVRRTFAADESYFSTLHNIDDVPPRPELISDAQLDMTLAIARLVETHGAVPVLLQPPQLAHWEFAVAFGAKFRKRCHGAGPLFLDFGSPAAYPDLFAPVHHMDDDHLNAAGAEIFSAIVAERLSDAISDRTIAAPLCL